jgi:hypothetical protein
MPLKEVPLGEWIPDIAPSHSTGLALARNVSPVENGYAPVGSFSAVTSSLGAAFVGGGAFIGSDGVSTLLAATPTKLRRYSGTWSDVLAVTTASRWYFAQFGDNVVYANGGQLGRHQLVPGTAGVIATAPTNAIDVATVRDWTMCLTADSFVKWSGFNDCTFWAEGGTNQSDVQPLLDGGTGVRIVGGEYGIILQKNAIRRVTYVGPPVIFQFDVISPEVGCMAAGSVVNVGRLIFFLSERGFEMCDGETVTPIADEKVNRWFFANYSRSDIANIWSAIDPRQAVVYWGMPGTPGRLIAYNWLLKRWYTVETDVAGILTGRTSNVSIDGLDLLYPSGIDSIPVSLDDAMFQGGNPLLLLVDGSNQFGTLSGKPLQADIVQPNLELTPGRRSRLRNIRPVSDAINASVSVSSKMRAGDGEALVTSSSMRLNGNMPIRSNGRYFDIHLTIPAGEAWSYLQACEYEFEPGDAR